MEESNTIGTAVGVGAGVPLGVTIAYILLKKLYQWYKVRQGGDPRAPTPELPAVVKEALDQVV